MLKLALLLK